jgi:heme exporter protein CcmD
MNWDANHAGFVLAAYALTALALAGLIAWVLARDRALRQRLAEHEGRKT